MLADFDIHARAIVDRVTWAPDWLISLIVFGVALLAALIVHRVIFRVLTRLVEHRELFWRSLVSRGERPSRFAIVVFALSIAAGVAPLSGAQVILVQHLLLVAFIGMVLGLAGPGSRSASGRRCIYGATRSTLRTICWRASTRRRCASCSASA